jgi:hypothetical protein
MIALLRTTFTARVIVVISAVVVLAAFSVGAVMNLVV